MLEGCSKVHALSCIMEGEQGNAHFVKGVPYNYYRVISIYLMEHKDETDLTE